MKKIVIVGGGNAGCLTALYCAWHGKGKVEVEVELIHNPKIPPERVGQGTVLEAPALLWAATGFNWYNNNIHATPNRAGGFWWLSERKIRTIYGEQVSLFA